MAAKNKQKIHLSLAEDVDSVPDAVAQFLQLSGAVFVMPVNGKLHLPRAMVESEDRVARPQLQQDEVCVLPRCQFPCRAVVEDQSVVLLGDELNARVTVLALREGCIPRPPITMETVSGVLATRAVKLVVAGAAGDEKQWTL